MRTACTRILLGAVVACSLLAAYRHATSAEAMARAAGILIHSLNAEQRAELEFSMDAESRTFWHFIPTVDIPKRYRHTRPGLIYKDMTSEQRHLADSLLSAGLSRTGFAKATTIMSLEGVLRVLENDSGVRRDPEKYHFSVFGAPGKEQPWGYRVEGHHLSLHYTVVDGQLVASPTFFGANPRRVPSGPRQGLRTLPREEDLGRELMNSFSDAQRVDALVAGKAYKDILTSADRVAAMEGQPAGLGVKTFTAGQKKILDSLIAEYAYNMPPEIAEHRLKLYHDAGDEIHFAWAGSTKVNEAHYYRVQSPAFLIEYDCIQNKANHIHSVWREFSGDFGRDVLKAHYERAHR